jgi:beta-lactamase superfamily II metal-dependent hydrolase
LEEQGVDSLDYVIASHYDADHLNGIVGALNAFDVKQVLCPDYAGTSKVYDSFWKTVSQKQIPYEYPEPGAHYVLGEATFIVVGPVSYKYDDANNNSIVMKVVNLQDSFLITGDAERESEEDMCAAGIDLSCTVYMAGHHGSASSTTWDLLERALPEYVVVSCGKDNSYGHPHEETLEKIQSIDARLFRTDLQGTVVAVSSGKGITWNVNSLD